MPTRDIACLNCGFAGMLDIHCERDDVPKDRLFQHLGHNPYSGDLHYRCPACEIVLLVDPMAVLGEKSLKGSPGMALDCSSGLRSSHSPDNRVSPGGSAGWKAWHRFSL